MNGWELCPTCGQYRGHEACARCSYVAPIQREPAQGPVKCPYCGAKPHEPCTKPNGEQAATHRARIVLSIVGNKSAAAAAVVENILAENRKRLK